MNQRIDAIFTNGVFHPARPVNIPDGEHVLLHVESRHVPADDLSDVEDLLDVEFMESCRQKTAQVLSLEEVRKKLGAFTGSLADRISEERDER